MSGVFAQDYRYTTDKANAYEQVTFLGNHDMGRIGGFLVKDNPRADEAELLGRDLFAHELMFLSCGNRVVYSGDEQASPAQAVTRTPFSPCSHRAIAALSQQVALVRQPLCPSARSTCSALYAVGIRRKRTP